jgi:hypothetical protein
LVKEVTIDFSCLDDKSDRDDYDSRKTLKKSIDKALEETNWRLMSSGISYRLGYLSGSLRAYESDEDIKKLVMKSKNLKKQLNPKKVTNRKNTLTINNARNGEIIL